MSFELFRQINTFLPLLAGGWLTYRAIIAWPADWAKPNHVWHYRGLLIAVLSYVFLTSFGSIVHEALHTRATFISCLYTVQSLGVVLLCHLWPKRARSST